MTERVNFHVKGKLALGVLSGLGRYFKLNQPLKSAY